MNIYCHSSIRCTGTKGNRMVCLSRIRQRWSVCRRVFGVQISHFTGVLVAAYLVFKSLFLLAVGLTSSAIVIRSIAVSVYNSLMYTKGLIISENSFGDVFLSKYMYAEKYGLSLGLSLGKKFYEIIDSYLNKIATHVVMFFE